MLKGKIAIVTGGSRGIGAAVVQELASQGADVAVIYAGNQELAEKVCQDCRERYGVRAGSYCCNVADFEAAKELAAKNVLCNAVAPGFIETDMTKELSGAEESWMSMIPLGRAGAAREVAKAVVFLADADYITGEVLRVDGGMGM